MLTPSTAVNVRRRCRTGRRGHGPRGRSSLVPRFQLNRVGFDHPPVRQHRANGRRASTRRGDRPVSEQCRPRDSARVIGRQTPRCERTSRRHRRRIRWSARHRGEWQLSVGGHVRDARDERPGIRMGRLPQRAHRQVLDDAAAVHDQDPGGDLGDDGDVVADEQDAGASRSSRTWRSKVSMSAARSRRARWSARRPRPVPARPSVPCLSSHADACPPDNSLGYWRARIGAIGNRTAASRSIARVMASPAGKSLMHFGYLG